VGLPSNAVARVDLRFDGDPVVETIALPGGLDALCGPDQLVGAPAYLWVRHCGRLTRIDAFSNSTPVRRGVSFVAYGDGSLWLLVLAPNRLERVDPTTGRVLDRIDLSRLGHSGPRLAWVDHGAVWTAGYADATIWKLDASTGRVSGSAMLAQPLVAGLAGPHAFWVGTADGRLLRVDGGHGQVTEEARLGANIGIGTPAGTMVSVGNALWVVALSRCDLPPCQPPARP
jgi:streptogramin lyase